MSMEMGHGMERSKSSPLQPEVHEGESEKIVSPALMYGAEMYLGMNHAQAFELLLQAHPELALLKDFEFKNGFKTSEGRFVGREEALEIAGRNDQVKEGDLYRGNASRKLSSEDLKH